MTAQGGDSSVGPIAVELDHPELPLSQLVNVAEDFLLLLREVSADVAGPGAVRWVVADVSRSSPVRLSVRPVAARDDIRPGDLQLVNSTITRGIALIQSRAERPPHFDDRALEKAKSLARRVGTDLSLVRVGGSEEPTSLTAQLIANVDSVLGQFVTSRGTIEGWLEAVNVHDVRYFSVYDALTGQRVRCNFGTRISAEDVGRAMERRVAVFGEIKYRPDGSIVDMKAESLEIFSRPTDLPSAEDVRGILKA